MSRRLLMSLVAVAVIACGGGDSGTNVPPPPPPPPPPPATVATVAVTLSQSSVTVGGSATASAQARDASGGTISGRSVTWSSSNSGVATINSGGAISAVSPGTATIQATVDGVSGTAQLTVTQVPVASVAVVLGQNSLAPGGSTTATAHLQSATGATLTGRAVSWSSSNPAVATVSQAGLVTALAPGSTQISASSEGQNGSATLTVIPPPVTTVTLFGTSRVKVGDSYQYTVEARLADGTLVTRPVSWSVVEVGKATISAGGVLMPLQTGTITVRATVDGVIGNGVLTAYDWVATSGGGIIGLGLDADLAVTNQFGQSDYPRLLIACNGITFGVGVSVDNMVTASGAVSYSFDGGAPTSGFWIEASDFDLLTWPGITNLSHKNFALAIALSSRFGFAFNEFQAGAHATIFRVTGLSTLLPPLLAACPGNAILAPGAVPATPEEVLRKLFPSSGASGRSRNGIPTLVSDGSGQALTQVRLPAEPTELP